MSAKLQPFVAACLAGVILLCASLEAQAQAKKRGKERFQEDKAVAEADDLWIYNDLDAARTEADRTGRPILLVFR